MCQPRWLRLERKPLSSCLSREEGLARHQLGLPGEELPLLRMCPSGDPASFPKQAAPSFAWTTSIFHQLTGGPRRSCHTGRASILLRLLCCVPSVAKVGTPPTPSPPAVQKVGASPWGRSFRGYGGLSRPRPGCLEAGESFPAPCQVWGCSRFGTETLLCCKDPEERPSQLAGKVGCPAPCREGNDSPRSCSGHGAKSSPSGWGEKAGSVQMGPAWNGASWRIRCHFRPCKVSGSCQVESQLLWGCGSSEPGRVAQLRGHRETLGSLLGARASEGPPHAGLAGRGPGCSESGGGCWAVTRSCGAGARSAFSAAGGLGGRPSVPRADSDPGRGPSAACACRPGGPSPASAGHFPGAAPAGAGEQS